MTATPIMRSGMTRRPRWAGGAGNGFHGRRSLLLFLAADRESRREHDPKKWLPVFGKDHAKKKTLEHDVFRGNTSCSSTLAKHSRLRGCRKRGRASVLAFRRPEKEKSRREPALQGTIVSAWGALIRPRAYSAARFICG
jgi:hypothetical protein